MNQKLKQRIVGAGILLGLSFLVVLWLLDAPNPTSSTASVSKTPRPMLPAERSVNAATSTPVVGVGRVTPAIVQNQVAMPEASKHDVRDEDDSRNHELLPTRDPTRSPAPKALTATHKLGSKPVTSTPSRTIEHAHSAKTSEPTSAPSAVREQKVSPGEHSKSWMVQLGTFKDQRNVRVLESKIRKHGYATRVDDVDFQREHAFRLRVGPVPNAEAARSLQGKLVIITGLRGVVTEY